MYGIDNPKNFTYQLMQAQESRVLLGKIISAKPSVDNKTPKRFSHLNQSQGGQPRKTKNLSRKKEIEMENNALIQKMLNIMQRGVRSTSSSPQSRPKNHNTTMYMQNGSFLPGGGIPANQYNLSQSFVGQNQNHNQSSSNINISQISQSQSSNNSPSGKIGSLNYYKRKKDIDIINNSNKQLLKALQNVKPVVSRQDQKNHEKRINKLKQHLCQVRYSSPSNFVYPEVNQENNNFHSSQFLFVKNPSYLNIGPVVKKRNRSYKSFNNSPMNRASTSNAASKTRMRNQFNQSADFTKLQINSQNLMYPDQNTAIRSQTPMQIHHNQKVASQMKVNKKHFDLLINQPKRNKRGSVQHHSPSQNLLDYGSKPQTSYQPHRKLKARKSQITSPFSYTQKDLQIMTNYMPADHNGTSHHFMTAKNGNPYAQTSAGQRKKFVKQKNPKNYIENTQINIFNTNITHPGSEQHFTDIHIPKVLPAAPDSTIKFVEPKIMVNKVHEEQDDNVQRFYNFHLDMNRESPSQQQSPQFINDPTHLGNSPMTQQKLIFDSENNQDQKSALGRSNTRNLKNEQEKINPNQIINSKNRNQQHYVKHQKTLLKSIYEALNFSKQRKARIHQNVLDFIRILKKKVLERKLANLNQPIMMQSTLKKEERKSTEQNLAQVLNQWRESEDEASEGEYSEDTFHLLEDQEEYIDDESMAIAHTFVNILQYKVRDLGKQLVMNLANKSDESLEKEQQIVDQARQIFNGIRDQQLKQKAQYLVLKFIDTLHRKVDENKKKQALKELFAKGIMNQIERAQDNSQFRTGQNQGRTNEIATQFIQNIKYSQEDTVIKRFKQKVKKNRIPEKFSKLSPNAKNIIKNFFELLWSKSRIRNLKRVFIQKLKLIAQKNKIERDFIIKRNAANQFMKIAFERRFSNEGESLSVHYSQESFSQDEEIAQQFVEKIKHGDSQPKEKVVIKNMKKAQDNALRFINILKNFVLRRQRINQYVFKLIDYLKKNMIDRRAKKQRLIAALQNQNRKQSNIKMFAQKIKQNNDVITLSKIKDQTFHSSILYHFKRLFVKLFQLDSFQRQSRIFSLYFARDFKNQVISQLQTFYDKNNNSASKEQPAVLKQVKAFLFLNKLKIKYQTNKGLYKAKEFMNRLRVMALKTKKMRNQLYYLLQKATSAREKQEKLRQIVARVFIQKPYSYYERFNPFTNYNVNKHQVKRFITDLFQRNHDIVGRPRNIFRNKNQVPSQRQIRLFVAQQFQQKHFKTYSSNRISTAKNVRVFATRLKQSKDIISISKIQDLHFHRQIQKEFKKLFVKLFQLTPKERESKIYSYYFARDFKTTVIKELHSFLDHQKVQTNEDPNLIKQVQAFLFLNELKNKYQKHKGLIKAKEYVNRLRVSAVKTKSKRRQIRYLLSQADNAQQKIKVIRYFMARLFLQKTYAYYERFNPFLNKNLTTYQVKRFIADLFQRKQDIIGRPRNIFCKKGYVPSRREVKLFIALLFQQKICSNGPAVSFKAIKNVKVFGNKLKQNKAQSSINIAQIKDKNFHERIQVQFKKLFVRLFQLNSEERKSQIYCLYFARQFKESVIQILQSFLGSQRDNSKDEKAILHQVEAFLFLNRLKLKYQRIKGLDKVKEFVFRLIIRKDKAKNLKKQFLYLIGQAQNIQQKIAKLRYFIARMFQQKTFDYYRRYNPFRHPYVSQQQIKLFIADLFQRNHDIIGRPRNIFAKKGIQPSQRQVRIFIAQQFQRKLVPKAQQIFNYVLQQRRVKNLVKKFIQKLKDKVQLKKKAKIPLKIPASKIKNVPQKPVSKFKKVPVATNQPIQNQMTYSLSESDDQSGAAAMMQKDFMQKMILDTQRHISEAKSRIKDQLSSYQSSQQMMKSKHRGAEIIGLSKVKNQELHQSIKKLFMKMFVKLFQLKKHQRGSQIHQIYIGQQFKQSIQKELEKFVQSSQMNCLESQAVMKKIKAFIFLNKLKDKYLRANGYNKAKQYIDRLRYKANKERNQHDQLKYMLSKKQSLIEKMQTVKHFIARLFLYKSFRNYRRYNPFRMFSLTPFDVKLFLADLFQRKRDLVGRPKNIFKAKIKMPTQKQVRYFIAKQFQLKAFNHGQFFFFKVLRNQRIFRIIKTFIRNLKEAVRKNSSNKKLKLKKESSDSASLEESISANQFMMKMIKQTESHISESKDIISKISSSSLIEQKATEKSVINLIKESKEQKEANVSKFIGNLKEKHHDEKIQSHANRFIGNLQNTEDQSLKTDQNVKKFVQIFKSSYGKGKFPQQ